MAGYGPFYLNARGFARNEFALPIRTFMRSFIRVTEMIREIMITDGK